MRRIAHLVAIVALATSSGQLLAQSEMQKLYLVVSDRTAQKLIRFDPISGHYLDSFAENLGYLDAVTFGPDQNLYVSAGVARQVYRYNGSTGQRMDTFVGLGNLMYAAGLDFGPDGHLYVSDYAADEIDRFDGLTGDHIDTFVARGSGGLDGPVELLFGANHMLYVASQRNHRILRFDAQDGSFVDEFVGAGSGALCPEPPPPFSGDPLPEGAGGLCGPYGIVFGPDGNLYVTSTLNGKVLRYEGGSGNFMGEFVTGLDRPTGLVFHQGSLYVSTQILSQPGVYRFDASTGTSQGLFAWEEIEGPHDVLFYTWESQLSATGGGSAIGSLPTGQRVVAWTDSDADGSGIWAQRYDSEGQSQGPPVRVNQGTAGNQHSAAIDYGSDGFVVVWISETGSKTGLNGERVLGRFYDSGGEPLGGELELSDHDSGSASSPAVDLGQGQAVVAWLWSQAPPKVASDGDAVMAFLVDQSGAPHSDRIVVDQPSGGHVSGPDVVWSSGRPLVVWGRHVSQSAAGMGKGENGIVGVFLGDDGQPEGDELELDDGSAGEPDKPSVDVDGDGDIVVAWERGEPGADHSDIGAIRLLPDGTSVAPSFSVNLDSERDQREPSVASTSSGDFVVAWESEGDGGGTGVFGRLFEADGTPARTEILVVDTATSAGYGSPDVARDSAGHLTVLFDGMSSGAPSEGIYARTTDLGQTTGCVTGSDALCLNGERFRVTVRWENLQGIGGTGWAVPLTDDTGYFWFFDEANVELIVKVLDGTALNGYYWVFYGALSNVEYWLTVTDTQTTNTVSYHNEPGTMASVGDTTALPGSGAAASASVDGGTGAGAAWTDLLDASAPLLDGCTPTSRQLCLNQSRFAVSVSWRGPQGDTGEGQAVPLSGDTGYFWFFDNANVELVVKVLDGTALNGHYWVFYGALSNVEYTITVTDTASGRVKTYVNQLGEFGSLGDTTAFPGG